MLLSLDLSKDLLLPFAKARGYSGDTDNLLKSFCEKQCCVIVRNEYLSEQIKCNTEDARQATIDKTASLFPLS